MKIYTLIFLTFITKSFADETCSNNILGSELTNLASSVALPNCYTKSKINLAKKGKEAPLCNTCKKDFQKKYSSLEVPKDQTIKDKKQLFLNIAFQEYKKALVDILIEVAKLRTLGSTNSSYAKAINECKPKTRNNFTNCSSELKEILPDRLGDIQKDLAGELAQILSQKKLKDRSSGVLDRTGANDISCFIPEKDILHARNTALESAFTPELISLISTTNAESVKSLDDLFRLLETKKIHNIEDIRKSIATHPLLSMYSQSPAAFIKMMKDLNPKSNEKFKQELYSKANGDQFDQQVAENCENAFKTLSDSICSPEFSSGDIKLNPFNYLDYINQKMDSEKSDLANSEDLIQKNLKAFELCEISSSPGTMDASETFRSISKNIGNGLNDVPLNEFRLKKYEDNFSKFNHNLCNIQSGKEPCIPNSFQCSVYENYKKIQSQSTPESRLANSSNNEINNLLRSFIGYPKDMPLEVKETLIAQGIIPKENGTLVAQPEVPERKTDANHTQERSDKISSSNSLAPTKGPQNSNNQTAAKFPSPNNQGQARDPYESYTNTYKAPDPTSQASADFAKSQEEIGQLKDVQEEIQRRLKGLPNQKPASKDQANQIVNDSFKAKGHTPTPQQMSSMSSSIMQERVPASESSTSGTDASATPNRAATSNTESQLKQWEKGKMNEALKGMAGAQGVSKKDVIDSLNKNETAPKEMTKVAINIDDPSVTLPELFKSKLAENDPETQLLKVLLRNKNDFILQVKSMNFKVTFDAKNNFNVLLQNGDKKEAEDLRPQLELYLNKLKSPSFTL